MKKTIFDIAAEQDDAIRKEAFVVPAVKAVGGLALRSGKFLAKRPLASLGAAMTGMEYAQGAKRFSNVTQANRANPFRPPSVG